MRQAIFVLFILISLTGFSQEKITVRVIDAGTRKPVADVSVSVKNSKIKTRTNILGFAEVQADSTQELIIEKKDYLTGVVKITATSGLLIPLSKNQIPEYENGMKEFYNYLAKNIRYPREARTEKIQAYVFVSFDVDSLAGVQNIVVINDKEGLFGTQLVRLLRQCPNNWKCKVRSVKMVLPVIFSIEGQPWLANEKIEVPAGNLLSEIKIATMSITTQSR